MSQSRPPETTVDKSYFPILVQWQDTMEEQAITDPHHLCDGRAFKVLATRVTVEVRKRAT